MSEQQHSSEFSSPPPSPPSPTSPAPPPPETPGAGSSRGGKMSGPGGYREVTLIAILFAIVIGVVMNASITYAGLKIGFTIGGSAIAAVLGFGVLRGILRRGSILETNIAQTVASAVNTSNSGIIFTVPVLLLIGIPLTINGLDFWLITLAAVAGAILGAAFIIPLRKQMIDIDRLRFPTGTGVAAILKSPGAGPKKAVVLGVGILLSALIYLPVGLTALSFPADLNELDAMFDEGKITHEDRLLTQAIASWISDESAPASVIERGSLLDELANLRKRLKKDPKNADLQRQLTELEFTLGSMSSTLDLGGPKPVAYPDKLALRAFVASKPEGRWSKLRSTKAGWAKDALFGYSDLGWRMAQETDQEAALKDRDGDGVDDRGLTIRVDRDKDGRPDYIMDDEKIDVGRFFQLPDQFELVFAIAPFALGAGYITGRAGLLVLAGGILSYFILTPLAFGFGWMPETTQAHEASGYGFGSFNRPLGIGLLLGGALMGVLASLPSIREALKSVAASSKRGKAGGADELGLKPLIVAIIGAIILLFLAADFVGNKPLNQLDPVDKTQVNADVAPAQYKGYAIAFSSSGTAAIWDSWTDEQKSPFMAEHNAKPGLLAGLNSHLRALIIAIVGAIWIWFAGIVIAQCTGMTDWSPISGMALLTVVLILLLAGTGAVVGAVLIGAALCVAITLAADMMQDLRTGHLVGARPRRQQIVEITMVGIGPLVAMLTILLIASVNMKTHGVAMGPGTPTSAPQAQALQAVITGVQGGEMPYALYGFGALLGALLGMGAFSGLGVLVGLSMYLPFMYIATYGIGCIINMVVAKTKGRSWAEEWGVPMAAGFIVGESVLALIINIIVLTTG